MAHRKGRRIGRLRSQSYDSTLFQHAGSSARSSRQNLGHVQSERTETGWFATSRCDAVSRLIFIHAMRPCIVLVGQCRVVRAILLIAHPPEIGLDHAGQLLRGTVDGLI